MRCGVVAGEQLVSVVAERSIRRLLAVTQLIVPALVHVKDDGTQPHHVEMTLVVTEGLSPSSATGAPAVELACFQVGVEGDEAAAVGQRGRPVLAFGVVELLRDLCHCGCREVSHISGFLLGAGWGRH